MLGARHENLISSAQCALTLRTRYTLIPEFQIEILEPKVATRFIDGDLISTVLPRLRIPRYEIDMKLIGSRE